ncbi:MULTISPECIES: GTP 3',8-cyclase MoaA [unclassified Aureispira]|uniref:GTP 3',8-cyclase MoaA n=1 Tax=unclassified Aureispira TaxID=2649989 RepID=UPI000697FD33|nr:MULTISPECIES: GTP 3',8-cyclase MoaA [unclassified Aureispira]WMX17451.1 GTP 3',8-cyclase MoaA [Aureispira sp. CCB-E]
MIKDQHNRIHDYLRISLTERCNLRCFYCMPEEGVELAPKSHLMTYEEILSIATTFVEMGVKKIRLTGGEPLVRKDATIIIEALGALPVELAITTNGIIVDRFVAAFKKAGLKAVNISLDTLDRDKFALVTKRDDFQKVRQNIDLLLAEGFHVKINVVLMRAINFDEIIDFIELTKAQNLQIQFIEFMPFDGNQWDWKKGISLAEIVEKATNYYNENNILRIADKPNDTAVNYKVRGYQGSFAIISTITNPFCGTCNRIRLTANGRIKNCLFSTSETDLLTPFRAGEDIRPIILKSIQSKAPARGGWESLEAFSKPENHGQNRSMILIGG